MTVIDRLPFQRPFTPTGLRWRLVDSVIEGPSGLGLPAARISTDGGGWWVAQFDEMKAATPLHHRALRAMTLRMRGGRVFDVPFIEQAPTGALSTVPFSDGTTFGDGSEFVSGAMTAVLAADVALNDDTATIQISTGHVLQGGDVFSIDNGPLLGSSMFATSEVEEVSPGLWSVEIGPQFRRAHPAGTALNFNDPHCAMRLEDPEGAMWPRIVRGWHGTASALFVEALAQP